MKDYNAFPFEFPEAGGYSNGLTKYEYAVIHMLSGMVASNHSISSYSDTLDNSIVLANELFDKLKDKEQ